MSNADVVARVTKEEFDGFIDKAAPGSRLKLGAFLSWFRLKIHFYDTCEPAPQFVFIPDEAEARSTFPLLFQRFRHSQILLFFRFSRLCCFGRNKLRMLLVFLRNAAGIPHRSHQDGKFEPD